MNLALAAIQALYGKIPDLHCKGLCGEHVCGVILLQQSEFEAIEAVGPIPPKTIAEGLTCPLLVKGRCSRYEQRPLICRLWGTVKDRRMRCQFGCRPRRWLSDEEGRAMIDRARELDPRTRGLHTDADELLAQDEPGRLRARVNDARRRRSR